MNPTTLMEFNLDEINPAFHNSNEKISTSTTTTNLNKEGRKLTGTVDLNKNEEIIHEKYYSPKKIFTSILDAIGNTPLIRINNITQKEGIKCEILAKCEYMNPCGSTKDRAARRMVLDAEKKGLIKPNDGYTLIEPTSGNTGIGLALMGATRGYKTIFTMADRMSMEKENVLTGMGSTVIRTRSDGGHALLDSVQNTARRLVNETPKSIMLDQYNNLSNPLAHYDQTAEELIRQCDGMIDYVVMTAGTGGTLTGIGHKLKEKIPNVKIIAADPYGSVLAVPKSMNIDSPHPYKVEGNGKDFIPSNCEQSPSIIDQWIKVADKETFAMSRRLIKEEGMLVGGSSGTSMVAAMEIAKNLPEGKRVIVIFTDGIRNYMTKYINDDWMVENGQLSQEEYNQIHYENNPIKESITGIISDLNLKKALTVKADQTTVEEVMKLFENEDSSCAFVVDYNKEVIGVVTEENITAKFLNDKLQYTTFVKSIMQKDFRILSMDDPMYYLSSVSLKYRYIPIKDNEGNIFLCQPKDVLKYFSNDKRKQIKS